MWSEPNHARAIPSVPLRATSFERCRLHGLQTSRSQAEGTPAACGLRDHPRITLVARLGVTQWEVASECGLTPAGLSNWLTGRQVRKPAVLKAGAAAML